MNIKCGSNLGGGRREAAPPRTPLRPPCFPGGSAPRTPQKALRALGCSGWSLSRDRATCPGLPGAERFLRNRTFFKQATCPGQLRCLGQNFFLRNRTFLNKPLVPGSFAAWGRTFLRNRTFFVNKPLVPGSFAAWGRTFSQKSDFLFNKALVPGSFAAWGTTFFSKNVIF